MFLLFGFCCGTPPSCLKVRGGVGGGGGWPGAIKCLPKAPYFWFWDLRVWGPGLDN